MTPLSLKQVGMQIAGMLGVARFFRFINRKKLLVVMYHGITAHRHSVPIWTQLPLERFRDHLEFLCSHYQPVTLEQVTAAVNNEHALPERAVLVTFDDGLSNNYSCAFPLLQQLGVPATIFLTVDLIGSSQLLWFDELFFLLQQALAEGIVPKLANPAAAALLEANQLWPAYLRVVEDLKRSGPTLRTETMERLRTEIHLDHAGLLEDFGLLNWDQVRTMHRSGLVSFGVHTATHRILTELADAEWHHEIIKPKQVLEQELNSRVTAFCFPNGRPGDDFHANHLAELRKAGYCCGFTTENALFDWLTEDSMSIPRIPAGNDATSDQACFALNTSGAVPFLKGWHRWLPHTEPIPVPHAQF